MNIIDILGISVFCIAAFIIYKKAWFYSFYSFIKFLLVSLLSIIIGLYVSSKNPLPLPLTALQQSLLFETLLFFIFWRFLSFKKIFFKSARRAFNIDRFIFVHHLSRYINLIPSVIASFFVTFFLFTLLVSQAPANLTLQDKIEGSTIVKPLAYQIYFASFGNKNLSLFSGTMFKVTPPAFTDVETNFNQIKDSAILAFQEKLNLQRMQAGLYTLPPFIRDTKETIYNPGGVNTYYPANTPGNSNPPSGNTPGSNPPSYQPPTYQQPAIPTPTPTQPVYNNPDQPIYDTPTPTPQPSIEYPTPTPTPVPFIQQPQPQPADISQIEQDIFNQTNQQRQQHGVPPLTFSNEIAAVARAHSKDMNDRNFFDHVNPDGLDPFQRMRIGGISFSTAGENIAGGQSADIMMTNWMNSSGHRANILNPAYTKIGVGVSVSNRFGLLATQDFTN
ncbi:MAG: CAP domain-containing protein [Candidatus Levyibacteriota bacterium]